MAGLPKPTFSVLLFTTDINDTSKESVRPKRKIGGVVRNQMVKDEFVVSSEYCPLGWQLKCSRWRYIGHWEWYNEKLSRYSECPNSIWKQYLSDILVSVRSGNGGGSGAEGWHGNRRVRDQNVWRSGGGIVRYVTVRRNETWTLRSDLNKGDQKIER